MNMHRDRDTKKSTSYYGMNYYPMEINSREDVTGFGAHVDSTSFTFLFSNVRESFQVSEQCHNKTKHNRLAEQCRGLLCFSSWFIEFTSKWPMLCHRDYGPAQVLSKLLPQSNTCPRPRQMERKAMTRVLVYELSRHLSFLPHSAIRRFVTQRDSGWTCPSCPVPCW